MLKKDQIKWTEEIIETAYKLLIHKLAFGTLTARNESAFQLEFGYILKTLGQLYEFNLADKFYLEFETYISLNETSIKSKSDRARVDLLLQYQDNDNSTKAAIELKFFKKENHREPNNRYDVFKDISNLELYKRHEIDLCYFILATDHSHYCCQDNYTHVLSVCEIVTREAEYLQGPTGIEFRNFKAPRYIHLTQRTSTSDMRKNIRQGQYCSIKRQNHTAKIFHYRKTIAFGGTQLTILTISVF